MELKRAATMIRLILCVALALCGGAVAASDTSAAFDPAPCGFRDVPAEWATQNRIDCGWLHVSESRGKPSSRKLRLWVAIARADAAAGKAEDPLLYVHGGPGFATVDYFFPFFPQSKTWPAFRSTRDIVFFDQRGTGRSGPAFCKDLNPTLERLHKEAPPPREALDRRKEAFAACRMQMLADGFDFAAYNSSATVEDAEDLRRALKISQWNLYGISYGSLVGLEYLRRHPRNVRAAILDSVFPPDSPHGAEQITAFALGYAALQRACDRDAACRKRFPDMAGRLAQAVRQLDTHPLTREEGEGRITGAGLVSALWTMLVQTKTAPWVPLAVDRAAAGDTGAIRRIVALFGGSGSFGDYSHAQGLAVNCYEVFGSSTETRMREATRRHPHLTADGQIPGEADELCAAWQTERAAPAFHAPVRSEVPVLLYGGEFDPATPYEDAERAGRSLSNATLVFVPGASHAAFALDDCTRGIAHAFLDAPARKPDLACLGQRPATVFPAEGLLDLLESKSN